MISALLYLQVHSFRNRMLTRFRRLKQPKYLVGAIVGGLYFYFYFFRYLFGATGQGPWNLAFTPERQLLLESLAALAVGVVVVLAWIIPNQRAALTFTEAEVAFLFPAPIGRRGLIHFKLLRSQVRIFFTVFFLTLVFHRYAGKVWIHAAGWWLLLSILNLHFLGASFARTLLLDRGIASWARRVAVLAVVGGIVVAGVLWARQSMPPPADLHGPDQLADYVQRVLTAGPALYALYPFRLLVRPYLAAGGGAFLRALAPALLLLVLHYVWVVGSNVAFEEASVEASRKMADRLAAVRAGNWPSAATKAKARRPLFRLAPTGPPSVALFWKNLLAAGQAVTWRLWISAGILVVAIGLAFGNNPHRAELFSGVALVLGILLGWTLLVGPQFLRQDLRQDLPLADVLKVYPMRGWQVVLGEVLAPVAILTMVQWLLLASGMVFLVLGNGMNRGTWPLAIGGSAALLFPVLDALLLLIPNAAVLLFPSWIQTGREGPRGIEATGQRLILFIGQVLVFAIGLIPAALAFVPMFVLVRLTVGVSPALVAGSAVSAVVLAGEIGVGVVALGKLFERFDLSLELTP
jgi:hypothetical protein